MMTELEIWLRQATRHLSKDSTARVRCEILEHFELTRESALGGGATPEEASRFALAALGDAKAANGQYRHVLLTSAEARMLGDAKWETRAFCSRYWLKWSLLAIPVGMLLTAAALFLVGSNPVARVLLAGGIGLGFFFAAPFLPVYNRSRGRIFRSVKWVVMVGMLLLVFGADAIQWSWLLILCLWPMAWMEWTRVSIRRKLPVAQWPKSLYL
jgi:hypothetical protein